VYYFFVVWCW